MGQFFFQIRNTENAVLGGDRFDAESNDQALNFALNALAKFACQTFPPPGSVQIDVLDEHHRKLAALKFKFEIEYEKNVVH